MILKVFTRNDGTTAYRTIDGDMVDAIAFAAYGKHANHTQLLYEANPGIAKLGPLLPAGLELTIPPRPAATERPGQIKLWD